MQEKQLKKAKIYAAKLIAQYSRTTSEIQEKLKAKCYSQEVINQTIEFLKEHDYLNDKKYIQLWLDFQLKNRPCGKFLCYNKLRKKRLPKDLIQQILDEKYSDEKELAIAEALAQKKSKELCRKTKKQQMIKLKNYLSNKGFSNHTIIQYFENSGYLS